MGRTQAFKSVMAQAVKSNWGAWHNKERGMITDARAIYKVTSDMLPVILELFGTLNGGHKVGTSFSSVVSDLHDMDKAGEYVAQDFGFLVEQDKRVLRVLWHERGCTFVDKKYTDVLGSASEYTITTNGTYSPAVYHTKDGEWVASIMPVMTNKLKDLLYAMIKQFSIMEERMRVG